MVVVVVVVRMAVAENQSSLATAASTTNFEAKEARSPRDRERVDA